ncbi:competence/damage-inducible protein A [Bacteroidales bacterium OttesenSCG-928-B11]|nr:competence/damage-inducible protein A [Bacteroidales bacterium OttesenSCG-928-E04]MDL2311768.1 competence/damage-inducible protein A [Bacteroidales bacterium OttesenSCG-928-B11]MDL2325474.1 competence/damage-inducible protein A [Bacteroidales bacterium OttesenSCG-928-A14]
MIIINIGDELLIGQVINSNAAFIAERMNSIGIPVEEAVVISDQEEAMKNNILEALGKTDLVLVTGGLGPTKDDRTKKVLCEIFGMSLKIDQPSLDRITAMFNRRGITLSENNRLQAELPDGADIIPNENGTAPGMWFEKDGKVLVSMPGVPFEMKAMMGDILPKIVERFHPDAAILHKVVQTSGIGESDLSDLLEDWETALPKEISLAYLPRPGIVRLRLTATGNDKTLLENLLQDEIRKLKKIAGQYIWSYEDNQLEDEIGKRLTKMKKTLTLAESCTGGYIAHRITSVPGSSNYFKGSIVSYSNEIKRNILNVREANLKKHGAVSEPVVSDMAINSMDLFDADFSIAVSGIAGPDGGTVDKPVGTVWIAVATPTRLYTEQFHFLAAGGRATIIERTAAAAMSMLLKIMING